MLIEQLLTDIPFHRRYKMLQKFANLYYSKLMVVMTLILSLMSNTIFSLCYVIVFVLMLLSIQNFLDVQKARESLSPLLKNGLLNFIMVELLMDISF